MSFWLAHRIAVEISSSNFPRFDCNPNHGGVIAEASIGDFTTARQRVFHDTHRASYLRSRSCLFDVAVAPSEA
jgi:predicted acyl esterase